MKKIICFLSLFFIIICFLSGCSETKFKSVEVKDKKEVVQIEKEIISKKENQVPVVIYTVNEELTGFVKVDEFINGDLNLFSELIQELKNNNVLNEDVECKIGDLYASNELILDFNDAFLNQLISYGSTMEYYTVACVVNSFLESFDLNSVTLLVEGKQFETGHTVYDSGYTSILE